MTRAVRNRILKDVNGDINDHLRNHIHLTNCIHLKNHMHKHSPILADRSLMRDLVVLQRSRSLRDPSASPQSWQSPSVVDRLAKSGGRGALIQEGRRSVGIERPSHGRRLSGSSPPFAAVLPGAKAGPKKVYSSTDTVPVAATSERGSRSERRDARRVTEEMYVHRSARNSLLGGDEEHSLDNDGNESLCDVRSGKSDSRERRQREKGKRVQDPRPKTLSEQLNDTRIDSDDIISSNVHPRGRVTRGETSGREADAAVRVGSSTLNKGRRRKFRRVRRIRPAVSSGNAAIQNEMSVASNSLGQDSMQGAHQLEEGTEEHGLRNVEKAPSNGCGLPWNWSRIHNKGKTFLDMAGKNLACGMSEERGSAATRRRREASDIPIDSYNSNSLSNSEPEGLPLLIGSHDSAENTGRGHDYSGELGIFADHLLSHDLDSDLASEAQSSNSLRGQQRRHLSLTQKYAPQTFQDLIGQNLVAQALNNAVIRRRIGFIYVFYGPHGTGKTSCARIFARALNCQSSDVQKPCGYCRSCVAYDVGKSRNIREVGPVNNLNFESIMDLLDSMVASRLPTSYRVFIFDDCETLAPESWSAISKVVDRAPRRVVFILVCSNLEGLPHVVISRCQKFFYPKLKEADIICALQWISAKEGLQIDVDAVRLIASRSDGSLRDALMTLEQLSLLGRRISVMLVQELVGLVSDETLVNLLDLALSADTVNTIKNLREIMETGVEPLALMSQLAMVITDILAGSCDLTKERHRRKFLRRQPLAKDDMETLRQALKTLSEAEKQLRTSNDKLTWLTAALLQLAPDKQYLPPNSSADVGFHQAPVVENSVSNREAAGLNRFHVEMPTNGRATQINAASRKMDSQSSIFHQNGTDDRATREGVKGRAGFGVSSHRASFQSEGYGFSGRPNLGKTYKDIQDIWLQVLEQVDSTNVKEFLYQESKLTSVSLGAAPTVQLMFSSHLTKHKAEQFRWQILHAFESALGTAVTIEIRCEPRKDVPVEVNAPLSQPAPRDISGQSRDVASKSRQFISGNTSSGRNDIIQVEDSLKDKGSAVTDSYLQIPPSFPESMAAVSKNPSQSIVRGKVSLAHVIQQAEGCSQHGVWSRQKAISIAEKLEQENLRLESQSRNLLCWKVAKGTRHKISRFQARSRRPHSLLKLVSCGKCLSMKSSSR
ncbi:hypothetical protein MLD38_039938 [Melastoma candidum]|uniref:Uncharacterized protein n=1 Tax=Melastoma candidum TaxID=119954 RepID=A0ACB9L550_9MYRT|nr:hypothetical protein MLD38_039938 [Melastoma candidum]